MPTSEYCIPFEHLSRKAVKHQFLVFPYFFIVREVLVLTFLVAFFLIRLGKKGLSLMSYPPPCAMFLRLPIASLV
jgi:hypothetical protein